MNIFKFAVPLAAMICFGAFAPFVHAAPKKGASSSAKSSSSSKKKSTKKSSSKSGKSAKSSKSKSSKSSGKSKAKPERRQAKVAEESPSWIDDLPEVELPEVSGPAEEELLEPVVEADEP